MGVGTLLHEASYFLYLKTQVLLRLELYTDNTDREEHKSGDANINSYRLFLRPTKGSQK